jgi:hypothetical protein
VESFCLAQVKESKVVCECRREQEANLNLPLIQHESRVQDACFIFVHGGSEFLIDFIHAPICNCGSQSLMNIFLQSTEGNVSSH